MRKIVTAVIILSVFALVLAHFTVRRDRPVADNSHKIQYEDLVGRKVWIAKDVRRIVLLRSKDIYLLAALLGDELPERLAGWGPDLKVDDAELYARLMTRFPRLGTITVTGDVYSDGLNVEQLCGMGADLIIADKYMIDQGRKYTDTMNSAGLPVVYLDGSSDPLTGPQRGILLLGKILGREQRARDIADYISGQLQLAVSRIESNAPPAPRVYLEAGLLGPEGYGQSYGVSSTTGRPTSWGMVLRALKVRNVAEGLVVGMAPISPEALLKADPEIVVITGQNWSRYKSPGSMTLGFNVDPAEARRRLLAFTARPGWSLISAVRNRRVYSVFHNTVSPTLFCGVQALAKDCYPELFRDLDPEKNMRTFFERFMPIAYDGAWMCGLE